MGKKGSWFSAIKKVFAPDPKEKLANDSEKRSSTGKKKGVVRRETNSFIPIFRQPSSIEKILGDVEREQLVLRLPTLPQQPKTPPSVIPRDAFPRAASLRVTSPRVPSPRITSPRAAYPRVTSQRAASPRVTSPRAAYPHVTSPRAASPQVTSPRAASPQVTSPRAASPQVTSPRASSPTPRATSPRVTSPRAASPQVTSPRAASPRVTSLRAASPQVTFPRASSPTPRATSPRVTSPRAASPRVTSPRAASPRVTSPRASSPTPRATSPRVTSARVASPMPRAPSPRATSPRVTSPRIGSQRKEIRDRPEPTLRKHHVSATKIQAAYRGHMVRRSFKARKGLARLQGVVKGNNVKRQTANAMKCMQLLVRVQSQIQSRRIQMLENQAQGKNDKATKSTSVTENWDCSSLTKEEAEARLQRKAEAVVKRERAMAFAYSHKAWKDNPESEKTQTRAGGLPWWWNWLERQLPSEPDTQARPSPEKKPSPLHQSNKTKKQHFGSVNNSDSFTPKSSKSNLSMTPTQTLPSSARNLPQTSSASITSKYSRPRVPISPFDVRDDESLTSCPPFSAPGYMVPTASAKAKARASSNPRERFPGTPGSDASSRRLSFPVMAPGSFLSNKYANSGFRRPMDQHSLGGKSVDSTVSLPAGVGRKAFNRYV